LNGNLEKPSFKKLTRFFCNLVQFLRNQSVNDQVISRNNLEKFLKEKNNEEALADKLISNYAQNGKFLTKKEVNSPNLDRSKFVCCYFQKVFVFKFSF